MLPEGMYKVGIDVDPGEYKVIGDGGHSYVEVTKDSTHNMFAIVSNDNFEGQKYIKISAGQYIKLHGASLKVQ